MKSAVRERRLCGSGTASGPGRARFTTASQRRLRAACRASSLPGSPRGRWRVATLQNRVGGGGAFGRGAGGEARKQMAEESGSALANVAGAADAVERGPDDMRRVELDGFLESGGVGLPQRLEDLSE